MDRDRFGSVQTDVYRIKCSPVLTVFEQIIYDSQITCRDRACFGKFAVNGIERLIVFHEDLLSFFDVMGIVTSKMGMKIKKIVKKRKKAVFS